MRLRSVAVLSVVIASTYYVCVHILSTGGNHSYALKDGFSAEEVLDALISEAQIAAPVLVIDTSALNAIASKSIAPLRYIERLKVAIEKPLTSETISHHDNLLDIIYYEKPVGKDYWIFTDSDGTERAMLPFKITNEKTFSYPTRIDHFLQDWDYSRLLKCANLLQRPANITRKIPLKFAKHFADLRDFIKNIDNAHIVANGGTLLGWYRECSIIPHTNDVDFFIHSDEFSPKIRAALDEKGGPYRLFRIYGMLNDSYELAVTVKGVTPKVNIDLFSLYTTANESWVGGLAWHTRQKYKWSYPRITEICAGDLLGYMIFVPCNVERVLEADYGNWKSDKKSSTYVWNKSGNNISPNGNFTKEELKNMRKPILEFANNIDAIVKSREIVFMREELNKKMNRMKMNLEKSDITPAQLTQNMAQLREAIAKAKKTVEAINNHIADVQPVVDALEQEENIVNIDDDDDIITLS